MEKPQWKNCCVIVEKNGSTLTDKMICPILGQIAVQFQIFRYVSWLPDSH